MTQVAGVMKDKGMAEAVILARVILWLLSTRLGTLLLCGSLCFGKEWPFITKFSHLPTHKRENILQNWSTHTFLSPLRLIFFLLKSLCLYFCFSLVNNLPINFYLHLLFSFFISLAEGELNYLIETCLVVKPFHTRICVKCYHS